MFAIHSFRIHLQSLRCPKREIPISSEADRMRECGLVREPKRKVLEAVGFRDLSRPLPRIRPLFSFPTTSSCVFPRGAVGGHTQQRDLRTRVRALA